MSGLSIVSFNVNGLISFTKRRGYTESSFSDMIENICVNKAAQTRLNIESPEIICIQECKMSFEEDLDSSTGCPRNYESYFSLAANNKRYSGVTTYCLKGKVNVIEAARGFSWLQTNPRQFDLNSRLTRESLGEVESKLSEVKDKYSLSLPEVDCEGRCAITDHFQFVVVNLYIPLLRRKIDENSEEGLRKFTSQVSTEEVPNGVDFERLRFRLAFQEYLSILLEVLKNFCGRKVILVGDFNIILNRIDCFNENDVFLEQESKCPDIDDPREILSLSCPNEIYDRVRRLNIEMLRKFKLVDAFRYFYPRTKHKYTCWCQMNQSRIKNQGTRIDLILTSQELISDFTRCEILDHIFGSDHCPVVLTLRQTSNLHEPLPPWVEKGPPSICSKYLFQCREKQTKISHFIKVSAGANSQNLLKGVQLGIEGGQANINRKDETKKNASERSNNTGNISIPKCKHGIVCVRKKVSKVGVNKGKQYWSCSKSDQQKCNTFIWIEETNVNGKKSDLSSFLSK
ncbi:Endonuclease/Exonuclease/phosphatase family protein [Cryptosporidium felis]|nr:Endonuclease/Exonuclease/phosphatase family protein [Cryptosporidium felis]